jgi:HAMP domain-containing protein
MKYRINLYTEDFRAKSRFLKPRALALSGIAALALVLLGGAVLQLNNRGLEGQVRAMEAEKDQLQQRMLDISEQVKQRAESPAIRSALHEAMSLLEDKRRLYAHLDNSHSLADSRFSVVMRALSASQVEGLWLTRVRATGEHLLLNGSSLSEELVPQWIQKLSLQNDINGRKFSFLQLTRPQGEDANYLDFSLSTKLEQEGKDHG